MTFKPMLSGKVPSDLAKINYPVLASPKLDGIRCVIIDGVAMSRSLKPIPNAYVQEQLGDLPDGIDGELMIGGGFSAVTSGIMSKAGQPDFTFYVFDWAPYGKDVPNTPFHKRLHYAEKNIDGHPRCEIVEHLDIDSAEELRAIDADNLAKGYEGTMVRDPQAFYKFGRGTTKAGDLMKLKCFADEECTIIGLEEMMHNANEATTNELGRTQRSTHKAGKVPMDTLGAFVCRFDDGTKFRVGGGPGVTQELRKTLWKLRAGPGDTSCIGRRATIRFQPDPGGRKEGQAPRIPQFHGFRHEDDAS